METALNKVQKSELLRTDVVMGSSQQKVVGFWGGFVCFFLVVFCFVSVFCFVLF